MPKEQQAIRCQQEARHYFDSIDRLALTGFDKEAFQIEASFWYAEARRLMGIE
jgi:hypothetical protein